MLSYTVRWLYPCTIIYHSHLNVGYYWDLLLSYNNSQQYLRSVIYDLGMRIYKCFAPVVHYTCLVLNDNIFG